MKKPTLLRTIKDFKKNKVALQELRRAHFIIALLAISLAFTTALTSLYPIQLDLFLSAIMIAMLIILSAISLSIATTIKSK